MGREQLPRAIGQRRRQNRHKNSLRLPAKKEPKAERPAKVELEEAPLETGQDTCCSIDEAVEQGRGCGVSAATCRRRARFTTKRTSNKKKLTAAVEAARGRQPSANGVNQAGVNSLFAAVTENYADTRRPAGEAATVASTAVANRTYAEGPPLSTAELHTSLRTRPTTASCTATSVEGA